MRSPIVALLLASAAAGTVAADRVDLPGFYGNTWEMRRPEQTMWIYLNADGSWDGIIGGTFHNGHQWRTVEGNTCVFGPPSEKDPAGESLCFRDLAQRKPGDSWQLTVVGRDKVWDATIYKGRAVPPTAAQK